MSAVYVSESDCLCMTFGIGVEGVDGMSEVVVSRIWHKCSFLNTTTGSVVLLVMSNELSMIFVSCGGGQWYCLCVFVMVRGSSMTVDPSGMVVLHRMVIVSPASNVWLLLGARHKSGLSLLDSHRLEYGTMSRPLSMICRFDGRMAMSFCSKHGSPAMMSPMSSLVTSASILKIW